MVQNETVRASYAGNNSTSTPYTVPFFFKENSAVIVTVRTSGGVETQLTNGVDMTLSGVGNEAGGSFTTNPAIPTSSTVIIYRSSAVTQLTDYLEADSFPAVSHEGALDRAIMVEQESRDRIAHAFRIPLVRPTMGAMAYLADSVVCLDAAGVPLLRSASDFKTWALMTASDTAYQLFADAAARAAAVPAFLGQLGVQRDTSEVYIGSALTAGSWVFQNKRERLSANRTYYVRTDGNDSNTGLADTAGGAFLTLQKAVNVMFDSLDLNGFQAKVIVRAGTYTGYIEKWHPAIGGTPVIEGDLTTPSNVVISPTSPPAAAIDLRRHAKLEIGGLKITVSGANHGCHISGGAVLLITGKVEFGSVPFAHMTVNGGQIEISADYTISGGAAVHAQGTNNGVVGLLSSTVTLTGTPAFSTAFAAAYREGLVRNAVGTFSGAATGPRFYIESRGSIDGILSALPGNARGSYYQYFAQSASAANSGAGETTLWQQSVPANLLANDGDSLEFELCFSTAANANSKTPRVKFGATTFHGPASTTNNGTIVMRGRIMRRGATSQLCWGHTNYSDNNVSAGRATAAETLSGAVNFTVTGQGAASNDLVLEAGTLRFCEA